MIRATTPPPASAAKKPLRCAIYTRKSTEDGLEQEFNSLDAQREGCAAYIASQKGEGWTALQDRYDDGGFSGGNVDRPALQRLINDIKAGKIDVVVVYKLDRFSRSISDFHKLMEVFTQYNVAFVSITQQFNTTTSMGRMVLNMLLTFAQFERELISERTRDKIAAARRKGKWSGGMPVLGFDVNEQGKLVINAAEAVQVRGIFELYLQHQSLVAVLKDLAKRGWHSKQWTTRAGGIRGGSPFDKCTLHRLLTNVVYLGKVRYHEEVHPGEHAAIVDEQIWQRVQAVLGRNGRTGGGVVKNKYGALLKGLLRCGPCKCSMGHAYSAQGTKRYRYYVCLRAQKRGWDKCPTKSVPAGEIEKFVIEQIKAIGKDPAVLKETLRQARGQSQRSLGELQAEERRLERELARHNADVRKLAGNVRDAKKADEIAALQERIRVAEQRATEVREQTVALNRELVDEREVDAALSVFDPVWETLSPREQARIIQLLVERVDYNGKDGTVSVTFRPNGIKTLAQELRKDAA